MMLPVAADVADGFWNLKLTTLGREKYRTLHHIEKHETRETGDMALLVADCGFRTPVTDEVEPLAFGHREAPTPEEVDEANLCRECYRGLVTDRASERAATDDRSDGVVGYE